MLVINHRVNTIAKLKSTPINVGVEIDLRAYQDQIILHHDPFIQGDKFADWLAHYNHAFLILNIKCEGIEKKVIQMVQEQRIQNYFLLDVTPPFMFKLIAQGISQLAVRFSEFESIETCLNLKNQVDWVFIDNLTHLPIENRAFQILREHFKLCVVSPELLGRDEIMFTKNILKEHGVDAILTDHPENWP